MSLRDGWYGWENGTDVETGNITLEVTGELRKQLEQARASRSPITLTLDNMVVTKWRTQGSSFLRDRRDIVTLKQVKMVGNKEDVSVNTQKTGEAFVDHCANEIVALINQIRIVGESHTATLTRVGVTGDKDSMLYNTETSESVNDLQKKAYLRILKDPSSTLDDIDRAATLLRIMEKNVKAKTEKAAALTCCTIGCQCAVGVGVDPSYRQYFVDNYDRNNVSRPVGVISVQEERAMFARGSL